MRTGHIHRSVSHNGRRLEAKILHVLDVIAGVGKKLLPEGHAEHPLQSQPADVLRIDLAELAISIPAQLSVVSQPISRAGVHDSREINFALVDRMSHSHQSG